MAFTVEALAAELGIDPATLQAKPDAVKKWNGYLTEADTKYTQATAAQAAARETLEQAKRDQQAIDEQIKSFGLTEARVAELQTANAALNAAIEEVKKQGLNVDLSKLPTPTKHEAVDPTKALESRLQTGFSQMGAALRVQTRYQAVFGKPFTDDPVKLIDEALAARLPVDQYAEQKYKFADEEQRRSAAELQAKIDAGVQAGITKYKEENPVTRGHDGLAPGVASRIGKIFKPRNAQETNDFRKLSPRDRIAASVSRARELLATQE